jgi:hypothetical protein
MPVLPFAVSSMVDAESSEVEQVTESSADGTPVEVASASVAEVVVEETQDLGAKRTAPESQTLDPDALPAPMLKKAMNQKKSKAVSDGFVPFDYDNVQNDTKAQSGSSPASTDFAPHGAVKSNIKTSRAPKNRRKAGNKSMRF